MVDDEHILRCGTSCGFQIMGEGSIGGKAKGLVILKGLLEDNPDLVNDLPNVRISVPETLVVAGSVFERFLADNKLDRLSQVDLVDAEVAAQFLSGRMPGDIVEALSAYLEDHTPPLAVRSSGMLEDARSHAYAGLYRTYMLSNDQADLQDRLRYLLAAIKLVYASTFYKGPKAYARRAGHHFKSGPMAVLIQHAVGRAHGGYCYPSISGVAQSRDYYPPAGIRSEDGVATIALGLGKQVVSGERALRFCPKYPKRLLQRSTVEDVLEHSQRRFYALKMNAQHPPDAHGRDHVVRRYVSDAAQEAPVKMLAGTYLVEEHRIRETTHIEGQRVLTFANVLKYDLFPLGGIIRRLLAAGQATMDVPVEMEFAVDIAPSRREVSHFHLLQMRPMTASKASAVVTIDDRDRQAALCYTRHALGNVADQEIRDIVYVKPDRFDPGNTRMIARQVSEMNACLEKMNQRYLLVGPGRWGTADPWLGIPVRWADISNVAAVVETVSAKLNVEPSIGAHFFQNLVSLGISYFSIDRSAPDHFDLSWLTDQPVARDAEFVSHVHLAKPILLKVDGRTSQGVIYHRK